MNLCLFIGVALLIALMIFQDFFFREKEIDDRQGFPWSRRRKRK
jgi:hypothetical protein